MYILWQTGQHSLGGTTSSSPSPQIGLRHDTAEQSTDRVYRTQEGGKGVMCLCRLKALLTSTLNFLVILEEPGIAASTEVRHARGIGESNTRSNATWVYQTVDWLLAFRAGICTFIKTRYMSQVERQANKSTTPRTALYIFKEKKKSCPGWDSFCSLGERSTN